MLFYGDRKNVVWPDQIKFLLEEKAGVHDEDIEAVWCMESQDTWSVTFTDKEMALKVAALAKDNLKIGNTNVSPVIMQEQFVRVKIHWLPFGFRQSAVGNAFTYLGRVGDIQDLTYGGGTYQDGRGSKQVRCW